MTDKAAHFDRLLAAAIKDQPTVLESGKPLRQLTEGVVVRPLTTHSDSRGSVMEVIDTRWGYPGAIESGYVFTVRPKVVKGWGLHLRHQDRYVVLSGDVELVLYDPRPDSSTHGQVCKIMLSGHHRCIVNIPIGVWHADHNVGSSEAVLLNFPTELYVYNDPDKYRLPIDTDLIPYSFGPDVTGW